MTDDDAHLLMALCILKEFKLGFGLSFKSITNPPQEVKSPGRSKSEPGLFFIEYLKGKSEYYSRSGNGI
jgi:hypothetical protein